MSEGDSKYLAVEVLDAIYTPACDIFGLGITLLELATDIELPQHGVLWHALRSDHIPEVLNRCNNSKFCWFVCFYNNVKYIVNSIIQMYGKNN